MIRRLKTILKVASALAMAAIVAACAPMEAPRMGAGPPVITPNQAKTLGSAEMRESVLTFALEPLANAPAEMRFAFENRLRDLAPTRQLKITVGADPAATYHLKGYLSAVGDYTGTLVIYVLDVTDAAGTRVHRISGQVRAEGSTADPWASIKDTGSVESAAQEAIDALGNWAGAGHPVLPRGPA